MAKKKAKNKPTDAGGSSLLIDPGYDDLQLIQLDDIPLIELDDIPLIQLDDIPLIDIGDIDLLNDPWLAKLDAETDKVIAEVQADLDAYDLAIGLTDNTPDFEKVLKDIERW